MLPSALIRRLGNLLMRVAERRPPDVVVGAGDPPYLRRCWVIPRNRWYNIYLHHFCRSDEDRALHDHPWCNASILLSGTYLEHLPGGRAKRRLAGQVVLRGPRAAHRVELTDGPVWTLFLTGPRVREWGFHCPQGWKHWKQFVAAGKPGEIGPGCDG